MARTPGLSPGVFAAILIAELKNNLCIIVNPAAGRGKGDRILRELQSARGGGWARKLLITGAPGDEARLADDALRRGTRTIVVVGGDGTVSKVAQRILATGSECALAVVPSGTGDDIAKTLGVCDATAADVLQLVAAEHTRQIDVGRADGYYFLNSCGFGFDSSVLEATQSIRFLRGNALYIYAALAQLFSYDGVEVSIDAPLLGTMKQNLLMAVVANGRSLGGAFRIAPAASVIDGQLDLHVFGDANVWSRLRLFAAALRGTHPGMPGVTSIRTNRLSLTFRGSPTMEIDGELRRATSPTVTIECVPKALAVVAAPGTRL